MSDYARLLFFAGIVPFVFSFWPSLRFYRNAKGLLAALAVALVFFGGWDVWAAGRGHWTFAAKAVGPARLLGLPLEEVLFFVVIPFCALFTWEVLNYFWPDRRRRR